MLSTASFRPRFFRELGKSLVRGPSANHKARMPRRILPSFSVGSEFHTTRGAYHGHDHDDPNAKPVNVTYILKDGEILNVVGREGQNILRLAQKHDIPMEGACEGVCACSTCHCIVSDEFFDMLEEADEDEEDMLDLAWGLKSTSRLGCQIELTTALDGITVSLPSATRNFYVDGHVPEPH
jgi:ferredoxin-2, mitochondrial|eukprot:Stramenopile-MAST_4_protein_2093